MFSLQLTVTRVVYGHNRDSCSSSLLTSYGHVRYFNADVNTNVSFQVDFILGRFIRYCLPFIDGGVAQFSVSARKLVLASLDV